MSPGARNKSRVEIVSQNLPGGSGEEIPQKLEKSGRQNLSENLRAWGIAQKT